MAGEHYQRVEVTSRQVLRDWLSKHHGQKESIWLVTFKAGDERYLPYADMVREALCFGWIDSLPRKLDEQRTMRLLSPRKPKSAWSKANKLYVDELIAAGMMMPSGLKIIEAAKASGSWSKLDAVEKLDVPADLKKALKISRIAAENFAAFPQSVRKAILDWISQAKKPETRAARIAETVAKANDNIRANQWRQPSSR